MDLIVARPEGLYCTAGDFYIDPWKPVERAVITHAHSDHARVGHRQYLAHTHSEGTLRTRLGEITLQTLAWEPVGIRASKAKIDPGEDSFCRICRPIAPPVARPGSPSAPA